MTALRHFATADASPACLSEIRRLVDAAFGDRFTDDDWDHALGGRHVVALDGGRVVAHAAVVPRVIEVSGRPFRTGFVEAVATDAARQGEGIGSTVMDEINAIVRSRFELGALSTGRVSFYERLGWERWQGPTYARYGTDIVRTYDEDGYVFVLRFGPSAGIDLAAPISCESRPGDDW